MVFKKYTLVCGAMKPHASHSILPGMCESFSDQCIMFYSLCSQPGGCNPFGSGMTLLQGSCRTNRKQIFMLQFTMVAKLEL